jgi:hypothetical protein
LGSAGFELDHHRRPASDRVFDGEGVAHCFQQAAGDRETQTDALADLLTEALEWLEGKLAIGEWNAGAAVDDP